MLVEWMGKSGAVVISLCKDLLNMGYKIYVDNWYTSENLLKFLYEQGTCVVGTVKRNRLKVPATFKDEKLERGNYIFRRNEELLALKYQDKKKYMYYQPCIQQNLLKLGRKPERGNH